MSLWECKSAYGKGKELLNQNFSTRHVIYKTYFYEYFSAEHYEMPYLLNIGQIIDTRAWKIPNLPSFLHRFI
jgi:hypothetical protein